MLHLKTDLNLKFVNSNLYLMATEMPIQMLVKEMSKNKANQNYLTVKTDSMYPYIFLSYYNRSLL